MVEGQFTQTIYGMPGGGPHGNVARLLTVVLLTGLNRDQKFGEAIQHLNIELQVGGSVFHQ